MSPKRPSPPTIKSPGKLWDEEAELYKEIMKQRTPSVSSGTVYSFDTPTSGALKSVREVDKLRQGRRTEPRGAADPNNTCFRNSVLMLLLCNDKFMGYVRNRWKVHRDNLIATNSGGKWKRAKANQDHPFKILSDLWDVYWDPNSTGSKLNKCFEKSWGRLTSLPGVGDVRSWEELVDGLGSQEEARQFLEWMITYEEAVSE